MTRRTNPGAQPPADELPEQHAAVASVAGTSPKDVQALMDQIASSRAARALGGEARDAEKAALAAAEAQGALMQRDIQEVATGKTVKVKRAMTRTAGYKVVGYKDDGREILKPVWRESSCPPTSTRSTCRPSAARTSRSTASRSTTAPCTSSTSTRCAR
jgi:hypothetical protein